jgi:hypothetical protein
LAGIYKTKSASRNLKTANPIMAQGIALMASWLPICTLAVTVMLLLRVMFLRRAIRARGRLVEYKRGSSNGSKTSTPVIGYTDHHGKHHQLTTGWYGSESIPEGAEIEVLYAPDQTDNFLIRHPFWLWFPACMITIALLFFTAVVLFLLAAYI